MSGVSIIANRILRPLYRKVGEGIGEAYADSVGAHGEQRQLIINRSRTTMMVNGNIGVSMLCAEALVPVRELIIFGLCGRWRGRVCAA